MKVNCPKCGRFMKFIDEFLIHGYMCGNEDWFIDVHEIGDV